MSTITEASESAAGITALVARSVHEIATLLEDSQVRSVDTCNRLQAQVTRKLRRNFARQHSLDSASPVRWPHDLRMQLCTQMQIDPVLGVGGAKYVQATWPSIKLDATDETLASEELAPASPAPANTTDELEQHEQEESDAGADPFADLLEPAARSSVFVEPAADTNFHVVEGVKNLLRTVEKLSRAHPVNIALRGPTGAGKTSLPEWFAWRTRRPFFIFDTPTIRETVDAFGQRTIEHDADGKPQIKLQLSGLMQAIQTPRACIVIDEATRAHASILNGLLALLDHRKRIWLDALQANIEVAPGVVIFVTANIGSQYTGTWIWDAAFENRMDFQLDIGYLPEEAERQVLERKTGATQRVVRAFVEIANITRARVNDPKEALPHAISTRQLLRACEGTQAGLSPLDALEYTIVPTYSAEGGERSDRAHVLQIIQGKLAA